MEKKEWDFNVVISHVLRYGVILSAVVVATGLIMILLGLNDSGLPSDLNQIVSSSANYGRPTLNPISLFEGVIALNPLFIIQLGILILLATPIVRVAASILLFAAEKDRIYVAVTIFVLAVLLFSIFFVGPAEALLS